MRRIIAFVLLASALLVGCGDGVASDKTEATPSVSLPCGQACSGEEVDEVHCSPGALSVTTPKFVEADQASGKLELRKALPSVCTRIYWARFTPSPSNKASFEITITIDGKSFKPQASEKDFPAREAWTVGGYAKVDSVIKACLKSGGASTCLEDYDVTS